MGAAKAPKPTSAKQPTKAERHRMSEDKLELNIQRELVEFLKARDWHVERMLANAYQTGIPDLYCFHKKWTQRWVEVKRPNDYSFTRAQRRKWPEWERAGIPIWILTAATQEQYDLLFGPPNWRDFWRPSFEPPDVDAMLEELFREREKEIAEENSALPHDGGCP